MSIDAAAELPLSLDSRIEANYLGSGSWYRGIVTGVHGGGSGEEYTYDVEYDDDEKEHGVAAKDVRKVEKLSIHSRKLLRQKRKEREDGKEVESSSPAKSIGSPGSPDPFLELSQSLE